MTLESNKFVMGRFTEFIHTASEKLADGLIAPGAIFHVPGQSDPMRDPTGYLAIIGSVGERRLKAEYGVRSESRMRTRIERGWS